MQLQKLFISISFLQQIYRNFRDQLKAANIEKQVIYHCLPATILDLQLPVIRNYTRA